MKGMSLTKRNTDPAGPRTESLKPKPGTRPDEMPSSPSQPEIPLPDPPPPFENPTDTPLPPLTADNSSQGEASADTSTVRDSRAKTQSKREAEGDCFDSGQSNLSQNGALERGNSEESAATLIYDAVAEESEPDPSFRPSHGWSTYNMASIKSVEDVTEDFGRALEALRDDIAKLTSSVSEFVSSQTTATTNKVVGAVDNAQKKLSDTASNVQDRVSGASAHLEATVERNPFIAVFVAMVAGLIVGMVSRARS
jgi:ElaB/YqjD/DUF883 family membrane-anchored ribosome-binding protein